MRADATDDPPHDPDLTITPQSPAPEGALPPAGVGAVGGYTVIRELGRGGMGVVYEALDPGTRRVVALKVLDVAGRGYDLELALREARLMAKVSHPNTVFLYRAEPTDHGLLLAMEFVRGGTIADLLRREGRVPVSRAVALALQMIEGLRAYHGHGIVHRDIKPSNCFIDLDGRARIGDLGLARSPEMVTRLTQEGRFLGTPHYSSPEQLRGEQVDYRADIYAVGVTLYEMITGVLPFQAPDGVTLVARIMSDEPAPVSTLVPDIPPRLDRAILRALAKKPERRFATYEEFSEAIAPFGASSLREAGSKLRVGSAFADVSLFVFCDSAFSNHWIPIVFIVPYFLLSEAVGRASPMKSLLGLRIVARDGGRAGFPRAIARALIKLVPLVAMASGSGPVVVLGMFGAPILLVPLGSVRLHDRLTGTRVVFSPSIFLDRVRSGLLAMLDRLPNSRRLRRETGAAESPVSTLRFGTFEARHKLVTDGDASLWVADDPLLRREVWVRQHRRPEERCTETRRAVERPSRPRWIATGESEGRAWDAYDRPNAGPSLWACSAHERRRPWREARRVLRELAGEILAARGDDTLPSLVSLAQIIAGPEGAVVLLDDPFEPDVVDAETFATDSEGLRSFFQVLVCTLATGDVHRANEIARRVDVARLPVSDHELLEELWNPSRDPLQVIASMPQRLADEHRRIAEMSVRSRIAHVLAIALLCGVALLSARESAQGAIQGVLEGWNDAGGFSAPQPSVWVFPPLLAGLLGVVFPVVSALVFRGGLALRIEGVEVCTGAGRLANGWQLLVRSLPLALGTGASAYTLWTGRVALSATILVSFIVVAVVGAFLNPARSLGDLIASTYLRPR